MTLILSEVSRLSRTFAVREPGLLAVLVVNAGLLGLWSAGAAPEIAVEDGLLETLQILVSAGACALFFSASLEDDGPIGTAGAAIAAIAAIAILREIDVRTLVVPPWMMIWAYGPFRDTTVGVLMLLVGGYLWWRRKHFAGWMALLFRWSAWPFWLSGLLLVSSLAFDGEKLVAGDAGVLIEEFIELNGLVFLLMAGFRHCHLLHQRPPSVIS